METVHVVVSGNPGVGKSTILNSILGRNHFTAGVSYDGAGVTNRVTKVRHHGIFLVDTPGVSEIDKSSDNMKTLIDAISAQVNTKVLFIMTVDAGRVKPADVLLFQLILDHVGRNNIRNVALIINKVGTIVMHRASELKCFICAQFGVIQENIFLIPNHIGRLRLLTSLPFTVEELRKLENGDWNEIARQKLHNQRKEAEDKRRQAELERENRERIERIRAQNANEVARLQQEARRSRSSSGCLIL